MTEDQKTKVPNLYLIQNDSKMDSSAFQLFLDFSEFFSSLSLKYQKAILGSFASLLPESSITSFIEDLILCLPYSKRISFLATLTSSAFTSDPTKFTGLLFYGLSQKELYEFVGLLICGLSEDYRKEIMKHIKKLSSPPPTPPLDCPKCHSPAIKNGRRGVKQQYMCKKCGYQFVK